jgi:hypothetical protein
MLKVKFKQWNCIVDWKRYGNGRPAIKLVDEFDGSPTAVASVNLPEEELGPDEIFIKDHGENEGMAKALALAGIVGEPIRYVQSGFVQIPVCKLLITNHE